MTPVYEDVADYLVSVALGVKGTDLFGGNLPASPDNIAAIFEQTPFEPEMVMGRLDHDPLNIQVLVRHLNPVTGRDRAFAIRGALVNLNYLTPVERTIGGKLFLSIMPRSAPFAIGQDENRRYRWSSNYITRVKIL